jgi:outer membrane protein TolC
LLPATCVGCAEIGHRNALRGGRIDGLRLLPLRTQAGRMLTMWMLRFLATPVLGSCLLLSTFARAETPQEVYATEYSIGSVSEVDTSEVRKRIEHARGAAEARGTDPATMQLSLAEAIQIALQANLRLQIAGLDRNIAEALVPAARAKFHPVPGFDAEAGEVRLIDALSGFIDDDDRGGGTLENDSQSVSPFVRQELPTGGTLTLSSQLLRDSLSADPDDTSESAFFDGDTYFSGSTLVLVQPLLRGGSVYVARREILDAEYNLGVAEAQLRAEILQVTADVKQAYYNAILAKRLIEVSEAALARDRHLLEASEALFSAGRASRRDVLSAEIRISDDESSLAENRAAFDDAQLVLRDVLGTPIERPVEPSDARIPFDPVPIETQKWVSAALENRPEILGVLNRLDQTALAVRVAENEVLPALDFFGSYGRAGFSESFRTTFDWDSQSWTTGLHFEIPFGNVAARERLRVAKFANERVERELRDLERRIQIEVRAESISLRSNFANLAAQTAKLEQSRDKYETANTRFRLGLADNFDVTDAQQDVIDAETAFLGSMVDYVNSQARLEASIAGPL